MKKLLLTLIVSFALCGSIFAQAKPDYYNPNNYESNWASATFNQFGCVDYPAFFVKLDGQLITTEDDWADYEFASFIGDVCRGHDFMTTEYVEYGWPYPLLEGLMVKYSDGTVQGTSNETGYEVSFMMYNHATDTYYTFESCYPAPIHAGELHTEIWFIEDLETPGWEEDALILNFTSSTTNYTRDIIPYTDPEGKDNYCLIATPVGAKAASEVTNLTSNSYDLYTYDQAASDGLEWINHRGEEGFELVPGVGYLYANSGDGEHDVVTLDFGSDGITEGEYSFTLVNAENTDFPNDGWNLLGNPFGVDATIGTEKPFFTMVEGALVPQDAGTPIPAMEGFFVNAVGETGLTESVTIIPAEGGSKAPMFALNLSNGGKVIDRAIVSFGKGQQLPKFQIFKNSTKVYIPMDGNDYALVRSEGMGEMPVNFKAESNGTYSLSLNTEDVDFAYLHLIDNLTGVEQDMLANPSYSFSANTTDYASRFRLVFATGSQEESFAFFSNGSLFINNEGNATLQVVDVTGRIIKCENINGCASVNINAAPGVYMVRLINGDNMKVQKVVK